MARTENKSAVRQRPLAEESGPIKIEIRAARTVQQMTPADCTLFCVTFLDETRTNKHARALRVWFPFKYFLVISDALLDS